MDLTIIIVNWNTRDLLQNCLRSIEACREKLAIQTILVDNNSSDGSREMVTGCFPWAHLINSGGNIGFARANNLGLPLVKSSLVLFLNPDTEVGASSLKHMVDFMQAHPAVGALGCRIVDAQGQVQELGLQWFPSPATELLKFLAVSQNTYRRLPRLFPWHDPQASGYVAKLFGACLLVRQSVLQQVGSFDERFFMYCEDVDLCYRIAQAGWKLYYLSEVEILHLGASASSKAPGTFSVLMGCESFSQFMRKHYGRMGGIAYRLAAFLGAQVRLIVLFFLRIAAAARLHRTTLDLSGSIRKHLAVTRWALGLQKPVIQE